MKRMLTEEEKIKIYNQEHKEEYNAILNYTNTNLYQKNDRTKNNQLQQFYTNAKLSEYIYKYSSLSENKNKDIKILEPTAGQGDLIKPIVKENKNVDITMVEIDPENRKILNEMISKAPLILKLASQNNFLMYHTSERYDYIFMNPPFHLRKSEDRNLIRDTYDTDFIKRAFGLLKVGGELMAITGNTWKTNEDFKKWVKLKNKSFEVESRNKEKFSKISIDITVMKITKLDTSEDESLLFHNYYILSGNGKLLNDNMINPSVVMNDKPTMKEIKQELQPFHRSELEEIKEHEDELNQILSIKK
jgi:predicted RNA methylase